MTQDESDKNSAFSKRAGQLLSYAREKNIFRSRTALADFIGISRAMLYAYNDGTQEVSDVAMDKLAQAEARIRQMGSSPHVRMSGSGSHLSDAEKMWSSRLKHLRLRMRQDQTQMAAGLGITTDWLDALEKGTEPAPDSIISAIRGMEEQIDEFEHLREVASLQESRNKGSRVENNKSSSVKLNPAFAPPVSNPTQQDCIDHLTAYLAEAKHVPGLVAHTLIELKKHFKIADARAQREDL